MEIAAVERITYRSETRQSFDQRGHSHPGTPRETTESITHIEVDGGPDGYCEHGLSPDALEHANQHLVGENPLHRERLWERLFRPQRMSNISEGCLAAIDCALYDIAGKDAEQPVWQLLGGYRTEIPCYASTMVGDDDPDGLGTVQAYADFATELVDRGFPAIKLHSWMPPHDASPDRQIRMFEAVREEVGYEVDLMVDSHHYYSRTAAKEIGDALARLEYKWFEEPMNEYSMSSYEWLRSAVDVPIIGPETAHGKMQTRAEWIKRGIADISRVGVFDVGGLTPAMKTVGLCESFGVACEVHGNSIANMHLLGAMAIPGEYLEWGLLHPQMDHDTGYSPAFASRPKPNDGVLELPTQPGLGYDFDWDYIEANRVPE